ncbi:MAG: adenosine kinase [Alphaproteobacteria bacterium]
MKRDFDVAGVGNPIVDVIFAAPDQFLLEHKIAKAVMTLIDEFRAEHLLGLMPGALRSSGGSTANALAGFASFGGKALFIGKAKNDALGRSFAADLRRIGVHFDTPMGEDGPSTACSLIIVTPDGQRSMSTYLGACRELTPGDIDAKAIAASGTLYIEGYLWDADGAKAAIRKAITAARGAGRKVAMTLSDPFCVGRFRHEFLQLLRSDVDILFANEEEAKSLYEVETFDEALQQARAWPGLVALTRSEKGCVIVAPDGEVHVIDAVPVKKVVDTTGAGDQFAAGFLYGLSHGKDLRLSGELGALAAAEVISHYGARPERSLKSLAARAGLI